MAQYHTRFFDADGTVVECKKATASDWTFIPGVTDFTSSGGEAPTNEVTDLHGTSIAVGRSRPEDVSMTIAAVQIGHTSYNLLREARLNDSELQFRWRQTKEIVLFPQTAAGVTVAIAANGDITTAGAAASQVNPNTRPGVGPGSAIKIGTAYHIIDSVDPTATDLEDVTLVSAPGTAVAASQYSVVMPPFYQPEFNARVTAFTVTGTSAQAMTGSLTLALPNPLPSLVIGTV